MKVKGIKHGIYEIYWTTGGSSLASIGFDSYGYNWLAPCNWVNGITDGKEKFGWSSVSYLKLLITNDYAKNIKGIQGEGSKVKFNKENFNIQHLDI